MSWSILNAVKSGANNEVEVIRLLGAVGVLSFLIAANGFQAWNMVKGHPFDIVAYCASFPLGFAAMMAAIAGGASWKDKGVASAKITAETGAIPVAAPAGPQVKPADVTPADQP